MKTLLIAAPASGNGKTTMSMGILRALRRRGLDVCGYKVGPDYIDPAFLTAAAGKAARNLDLHLQGEAGVLYNLRQGRSEYALIEGVMGYFDGIYNTWRNSSYHLASLLNVPTLLIYTPKGEMFSAIPKIKGMAEFEDSTIQAVIFNKVNRHYYELLKEALEQHTALKVLGYVPTLDDVELESRHLGLVQSIEIGDLDRKIETVAEQIAGHVDLTALVDMMQEYNAVGLGDDSSLELKSTTLPGNLRPRNIRVAVAKDEAFSFYYIENLELLERHCELLYFSPLRDEQLPACDLLFLGGGYPEVFHRELSENSAMLRAIRDYAERGGCVYAECGGFMYLTESVEEAEMVGIFRGKTRLTPRLQRFGYIDLELKQNCLLGRAGTRLTAHEFHRSISDVQGDTLFTIQKTLGAKRWECGYRYKNVVAGYPHINFLGHPGILRHMLDTVEQIKGRKICI
ncbi:MAG: cobyrinate a,c-diamide synthase [bacterium]|nr:cobyrinate a,c-diamide synthase [bacterium]